MAWRLPMTRVVQIGLGVGAVLFGALPALAAPCQAAEDCDSGWCVDDVCCDSHCDGDCDRCNAPGNEGVCLPVTGIRARYDQCRLCAEGGVFEVVDTPECHRAFCAHCEPFGCWEDGLCQTTCSAYTACAWGYTCDDRGQCRSLGEAFCTAEGLLMQNDGSQLACGYFRCLELGCPRSCTHSGQCMEGADCQAGVCAPPAEPEGVHLEVCACRTAPFLAPTPPRALMGPLVGAALLALRRRGRAQEARQAPSRH